jgi:GntR family histidine utilization transcriptional repressor
MFAQQPRSAPAPFYEKVKQAISEKIHSGVWRPHDRIPSEAELVAQFGFSRMTINRALRELTDEGLLVGCRGGTFVAEPKGQSALFEVRSIAEKLSPVTISTAARCCCWKRPGRSIQAAALKSPKARASFTR